MFSEFPEVLRYEWMVQKMHRAKSLLILIFRQVDRTESADAIGWGIRRGTISSARTSAMKQIQSEVFLRLVEIDRPRGNLILHAINKLSRVHETIDSRDLKTWDDLLQYRVQDFGAE